MFSTWKQEKAVQTVVDEAQALADKLADTKPHFVESQAAAARFWAGFYLASGQNLQAMTDWPPAAIVKFASTTQTKIAALRKKREYDTSDGLAVWLHTARAVTEPRIAPAVREIWASLMKAGPNADAMAHDKLLEAGLPLDQGRQIPKGFVIGDQDPGFD